MNEFNNIESLDKQKIFDVIASQPNQLRKNYADEMREDITAKDGAKVHNIIFAGMGGSALAGSIAKNWLFNKITLPFESVRGATLPGYADENTLVFISSYSGNTAETISAFNDAVAMKCQIVSITAGGKLIELAGKHSVPVLKLPIVSQPRLSVFAGLKALACSLEDMGFVGNNDLRAELEDAADYLDTVKMSWTTDMEVSNLAKEIALKLEGSEVYIYSGPMLGSASYKWKIDINENSKQLAHSNVFSELNHNEMQGWLYPENKKIRSIILHSEMDSDDVKKRIKATCEVLKDHGFSPDKIKAEGSNQIQQLLYSILLGDFVSAYLGIINGIDPTPVEIVEAFKAQIA